MEGWSSCWEEKSRHTRKATPIKCLVPKGQGGPSTQTVLSGQTSPAGFALHGRGNLGSHHPSKSCLGSGPLMLSRRTGDACFYVGRDGAGGAQKLWGWDPEVPTPSHVEGRRGQPVSSAEGQGEGGSDRRQVTCLCSPGCLGLDMTGMAQRAPGSFGAIIQLTQNPSLPIGKAGVGGEEADRELREDWKKGAGSWPQG